LNSTKLYRDVEFPDLDHNPHPDRDPDHHQNLITWSLGHALPCQKVSSKSDTQTKQTDKQNQPNTLLPFQKEVKIGRINCSYSQRK